MKKYIGFILVFIGILIDQFTKALALNLDSSIEIIPNILSLTLVKNTGAAFGLAQGANLFLAIFSLIICVAICVLMGVLYKKGEKISAGYYMLLLGGIGNLIDRLFRGFVVDFVDTPFIATFNLADSFIVIGVIWLIVEEVVISVLSKNSSNG